MLTWNLKRIFDLRMIKIPYSFLKSNGFSQSKSRRYADGEVQKLSLPDVEKLCMILNVTPDDLIEWKEDPKQFVPPNHPIRKYKREESHINIEKNLNNLSIDKVQEVLNVIKNM